MLPLPRAASGHRGGGGRWHGVQCKRLGRQDWGNVTGGASRRDPGLSWCCGEKAGEPCQGLRRGAALHFPLSSRSNPCLPSSPGQAERGELVAPEAEPWAGHTAPCWGPPSPGGSGRAPSSSSSAHQKEKTRGCSPMAVLRAAHYPEQRDFAGDFHRSLLVCTFSCGTEKPVLFIPPPFTLGVGGFFWIPLAKSEEDTPNGIK